MVKDDNNDATAGETFAAAATAMDAASTNVSADDVVNGCTGDSDFFVVVSFKLPVFEEEENTIQYV